MIGQIEVRHIPVANIAPWSEQPRKCISEAEIAELAESIRTVGLLHNIVVRRNPAANAPASARYLIVCGERRYRAFQQLGYTTIPACDKGYLPEVAALELAIRENRERRDLNAIEEAESLQRYLLTAKGELGEKLTVTEAAARLGMSQPRLSNTLRLLKLPHEGVQALREGQITRSVGESLAALLDRPKDLKELLPQVLAGDPADWSTRKIDRVVKALKEEEIAQPAPAPEPEHISFRMDSPIAQVVSKSRGKSKSGKGKKETPMQALAESVTQKLLTLIESECRRDFEEAKGLKRRDGGRAMAMQSAAGEIIAMVQEAGGKPCSQPYKTLHFSVS